MTTVKEQHSFCGGFKANSASAWKITDCKLLGFHDWYKGNPMQDFVWENYKIQFNHKKKWWISLRMGKWYRIWLATTADSLNRLIHTKTLQRLCLSINTDFASDEVIQYIKVLPFSINILTNTRLGICNSNCLLLSQKQVSLQIYLD
jgi:hypothetical protein